MFLSCNMQLLLHIFWITHLYCIIWTSFLSFGCHFSKVTMIYTGSRRVFLGKHLLWVEWDFCRSDTFLMPSRQCQNSEGMGLLLCYLNKIVDKFSYKLHSFKDREIVGIVWLNSVLFCLNKWQSYILSLSLCLTWRTILSALMHSDVNRCSVTVKAFQQ